MAYDTERDKHHGRLAEIGVKGGHIALELYSYESGPLKVAMNRHIASRDWVDRGKPGRIDQGEALALGQALISWALGGTVTAAPTPAAEAPYINRQHSGSIDRNRGAVHGNH